ncbi:hypothetical protein LXL04_011422 [Taraxacum kok-saghyz]
MAPITTPLHRLPGVYREILLLLRRLIAHPEFQPGLWSGSLSEEFCYSQYLVFCLYVVKRRNEEPTTLPVSMFLRPLHLKAPRSNRYTLKSLQESLLRTSVQPQIALNLEETNRRSL